MKPNALYALACYLTRVADADGPAAPEWAQAERNLLTAIERDGVRLGEWARVDDALVPYRADEGRRKRLKQLVRSLQAPAV